MPGKTIELFNFEFSVYGRIVKIILAEKRIAYDTHPVNPFADDLPRNYLSIHPFKRVPALRHGEFILYETNAITQYLDETFCGPSMQPDNATERAKMRQIISIIDSYGYIPLVRKVFSERVFKPAFDEETNEAILCKGLEESAPVLAALENLVCDLGYMAAAHYSLADAHVIPMIDYFVMAPEGAAMFNNYPKLTLWWDGVKERPSTISTRPVLLSAKA
ncbi:glutathione S-transferase family protein [Sneathiella chungangensis]|uniref:Glutathione S-transferase family protein n=1 Tax=Sneathiella chungangensis TaxID=1418234 RepID=A0A845MI96_9PROT|nr:glutathione S-transferase family protein [Sneathiella chungangensis]MZR23007.1 glutathione S-transferase family protein [Sneathiella chungangensis]